MGQELPLGGSLLVASAWRLAFIAAVTAFTIAIGS
jgi:hypothetical protein